MVSFNLKVLTKFGLCSNCLHDFSGTDEPCNSSENRFSIGNKSNRLVVTCVICPVGCVEFPECLLHAIGYFQECLPLKRQI